MVDDHVPIQNGILKLNCLIEGEAIIFAVAVAQDCVVSDLKKEIKNERILGKLKDVDPHALELWKINIDLDAYDEDSLGRFRLQEDHKGVEKLTWKTVSKYWSHQPPNTHLHLIVKIPATERPRIELDQPPAKRARIHEADNHFLTLHKNFWKAGEDNFVECAVQIPDPLSLEVKDDSKTLKLMVIKHPEGPKQVFPFGLSKLLVVEIYEAFWKLLETEDEKWQTLQSPDIDRFSYLQHATVITGQPGIGKTVFLTYVLLRRLVKGLTTIYCDGDTHANIFDGTGVRRLTLSHGDRIPELDDNPLCCALVNLGDELSSVPNVFYPKIRRGRVVVATSPDQKHLATFAHEHLARICCMPTWEWGPLYIASTLFKNVDKLDVDQCRRLREVYSIFHGIPRLCFRSFTTDGLAAQWAIINNALNDIQSADDFFRATTGQLPFNLNSSHRLVRVEPIDEDWLMTRTELMSNRIAEVVFERIRMVTKARLLETLARYLADPDAHTKASILFEQAAHFSLRKGLTLRMTALSSSMTEKDISSKAKKGISSSTAKKGISSSTAKKGTSSSVTKSIASSSMPLQVSSSTIRKVTSSSIPIQVDIPMTPTSKKEISRYYSLAIREEPGSQNVHADFLDLYMTPISKTGPSIDGLFISSSTHTTYLFQMTVSDRHPISFRGLDKVVNNLPASAQNDICIVFVIPAHGGEKFRGIHSAQRIDVPQGADQAKVKKFEGFQQYLCYLDIDAEGSSKNHPG